MAIECEVNKRAGKISEKFIYRCAQKIFEILKKKNISISIAVVGNKTIRKFNKQYRKKNKPTDVLSFGEKDVRNFINIPQLNYLGEIIISYPEIRKQAKEDKESVHSIFKKLLVHGILHLLDYEHEKGEKEKRKMFKKQNEILEKIKNV